MPKKKTKSVEDEKFDKIVKFLYGGTAAKLKKKFRSKIFQEWIESHPDIVKDALAPPVSSEEEILQLTKNLLIEKEKISLTELLSLVKKKSIVKNLTELKVYIKKLEFSSNYSFTYPKTLKGSSIIQLNVAGVNIADFMFHLRQAYESVPSKMGDMVEISQLSHILAEETGWTINQIHNQIYQAYLEKRVDLQPGKISGGTALEAEDGSKFTWFQFR